MTKDTFKEEKSLPTPLRKQVGLKRSSAAQCY